MLTRAQARLAGLLIMLLGIWGGIIPFVGPSFGYSLGPDSTWTWTMDRLWLSVLPSIAAILGGFMLASGRWRPTAWLGGTIATVAGIWFVIGPDLSRLWHTGGVGLTEHGTTAVRVLAQLGMHLGLGVLIASLGAYAAALGGRWWRRRVTEAAVAAGAAGGAATAASAGAVQPGRRRRAPWRRRPGARRAPTSV